MNRLIKGTISLLFIAIYSTVCAKTYYVAATGGSDLNLGTIDRPWATWQKAINTAEAGDTVYFRGGVWYPDSLLKTGYPIVDYDPTIGKGHNGTHDAPICFFAYPADYASGNFPILDCQFASQVKRGNTGLALTEVTYAKFKGLTIRNVRMRNATHNVIGIGADNCGNLHFENMTVHHIGGAGFWPRTYDTLYYINCDVHDCCDSLDVTSPGGDGDGFLASSGGATADTFKLTVMTGCRAWNCSDDGFDCASTKQLYIHDNWFFNNGHMNGDGTGIKLAWSDVHTTSKRRIYNNLFAYNWCKLYTGGGGAIYETNLYDADSGPFAQIYNNSSYHDWGGMGSSGIAYFSCSSDPARDIIRNNIVYDYVDYRANFFACGYSSPPSYVTESHNTFKVDPISGNGICINNSNYVVTNADFVSLDTTGMSRPRKSDGSLPDITFMKLAQGSDLIDAGIDVGLPYFGSAPDIGYSEYISGPITPSIPVFTDATITNSMPSILAMSYSLTLDNIVPAASAFTVKVNSLTRLISSVTITGTKVYLTLASPVVYGDAVTVAYSKPSTNPLQTATGGQAASIADQNVTNNIVAAMPVYISSVIENATSSRLEMTYSLTLANIVPATSAFVVKVNTVTRNVSSVAISGTKVLLTLTSPIVFGDVIIVAYTKPATNPLQASAGGQAASIANQNVTNNVAAAMPVYVSSVIENTTPAKLEVTYSLTLANIVPATSDFVVKVNTVTRTVSSVAISATKVFLTLTSPVVYGDVVSVAYTKPATNSLQTSSGGQAASISAQSVINNCSITANQPPVITITSPTKSITFVEPATVTIEATASDPDGLISKVEFYTGSTKLGESSVAPFSFTWKEVPWGTYSMTAIATDNLNAKSVSAAVDVIVEKSTNSVNQFPIISISKPNKGKNHRKNDIIVIEAVASDPDGTISKVEFKNGIMTLAEVTSAPYIYVWEGVDTGTYIITAIAIDNLGAATASSALELKVVDFYDAGSEMLNLYPNPNNGYFSIDFYSSFPSDKNNKLSIMSLAGNTVYNEIITDQESYREFDLSDTSAGTYIIMIANGNTIITTKKFIIR